MKGGPGVSDPRPGSDVAPGPTLDAFRGYSRVERALLPFLREPTLWPVLVAALVHAIALVAPLLVIVWRNPAPGWPLVGIVVLGGLSLAGAGIELRDRGGPGPLNGLIAATWILCALGAWGGARVGIL